MPFLWLYFQWMCLILSLFSSYLACLLLNTRKDLLLLLFYCCLSFYMFLMQWSNMSWSSCMLMYYSISRPKGQVFIGGGRMKTSMLTDIILLSMQHNYVNQSFGQQPMVYSSQVAPEKKQNTFVVNKSAVKSPQRVSLLNNKKGALQSLQPHQIQVQTLPQQVQPFQQTQHVQSSPLPQQSMQKTVSYQPNRPSDKLASEVSRLQALNDRLLQENNELKRQNSHLHNEVNSLRMSHNTSRYDQKTLEETQQHVQQLQKENQHYKQSIQDLSNLKENSLNQGIIDQNYREIGEQKRTIDMLSQKLQLSEQKTEQLRNEQTSFSQEQQDQLRIKEQAMEQKVEQQNQKINMLIAEIERLNQVLFSKTEENTQTTRNLQQLEEHIEKQEQEKRMSEVKHQSANSEIRRTAGIVEEYQKQIKQMEGRIESLMGDNFRLRDQESKGDSLSQANQEYKNRVTALAEEVDRLNNYLLQRGQELETLRHENYALQSENRLSDKREDPTKDTLYRQKIGALSQEIERLQRIISSMQGDSSELDLAQPQFFRTAVSSNGMTYNQYPSEL